MAREKIMPEEFLFIADTHQYFLNGRELIAVTYAFEKCGITDFSKVPFDALEPARIRGDYVHQMAAYFGAEMLDEESIDPALTGYLEAIRSYYNEEVEKVFEIEKPVYSLTHGYAGTPDLIFLNHKGELCLDDFKTPTKIHPATKFQTAAYVYAWEKMNKKRIVHRRGVMLRGDGTYELDQHKNPLRRDFDDFLSILKTAIIKIREKIK